VLSENKAMRDLAETLGFETTSGEDSSVVETELILNPSD
jgi:hypothetical protein